MRNLISECAWCHKVKTINGWKAESLALKELGIDSINLDGENDRTHGICPACAEQFLKSELQLQCA